MLRELATYFGLAAPPEGEEDLARSIGVGRRFVALILSSAFAAGVFSLLLNDFSFLQMFLVAVASGSVTWLIEHRRSRRDASPFDA